MKSNQTIWLANETKAENSQTKLSLSRGLREKAKDDRFKGIRQHYGYEDSHFCNGNYQAKSPKIADELRCILKMKEATVI